MPVTIPLAPRTTPLFRVLPDPSKMKGAEDQSWPQPDAALNMDGFCSCPDEYSSEFFDGKCMIYFGACNHRHSYNILGRINEKEVDKSRLANMLKLANFGLKTARAIEKL